MAAKESERKSISDKKITYITRTCMTALTVVMIILFFCMILLVNSIQGTARVVNYAGLVRGETQRIIKLEDAGEPQDGMIADVTSFIDGLRNGSSELDLVRLDDKKFQNKMKELDAYFEDLKEEIQLVRANGYENTQIIEKSETFFGICDEATGLAAAYSQKRASALNILEKIVIADICCLLALIAFELFKALRTAAQNRLLQKKVYLDEATGLPNKNKCEEILDAPLPTDEDGSPMPTAVCVFDLNNLRTINNNLGHDKGDAYIKSFAVQMRLALPEKYFAGRDGGDEFIAVMTGVGHADVQKCLADIRKQTDEYSQQHPEMPISYAAGYALSTDFEGSTMRELFKHADKNMYVDKNRAKMEEAAERKRADSAMLSDLKSRGYDFSSCMYCDALLDQYRMLRSSSSFFLTDDGSYSGAVEEIVSRFSTEETRKDMWKKMQLASLDRYLTAERPELDLIYVYRPEESGLTPVTGGDAGSSADPELRHGRMTVIFCDASEDGSLHHFILGFEKFQNSSRAIHDEKDQLTRYYDQMKQQIMENGNYMDALMETAQAVYTVDLTNDILDRMFFHTNVPEIDVEAETPLSYNEYCMRQSRFITEETLESYRIVDSSEKLIGRFKDGDKQVTVEYRERGRSDRLIWLQKTVLMTRETVYDSDSGKESQIVRGLIMFKDTSAFHEKEEAEKKRLQTAFDEADSASRAKTDFLNRMSHDIRTPINGIMGMLDIIRKNRGDSAKMDECLEKINVSTAHLLALVNDVLDMSRLESAQGSDMEETPFDLEALMDEVASLLDAQIINTGLTHNKYRKHLDHTKLIGSPLHLKQIMVNLFSNSIKYNKPDGVIDTYAEEISVSDDGKTALYEFRITDTGIGMSEDFVKNKLFKPFTQEQSGARTEYMGTGLGLSIVDALVHKMGGDIEVESVQGEGTTFTFRLPFMIDDAADDKAHAAEAPEKQAAPDLPEGLRILLVEDNAINMEIAEFYLKERGALVTEAWNGSEAVDIFAASAPGEFDMILMDVMMPVMDGLEATRRIRKLERPDAAGIAIIAMTAQVTQESARECIEAGMNDHMAKPVNADRIAEMIAKYLKK